MCHVTVRELRTRKKTLDHYDNSLTCIFILSSLEIKKNVHQHYFSYNNIQILFYNGFVWESTYCIFECVFTSDIVQFFNSEGGEIETTAMTLLNIPLVIILLIGCKIQSIKRKAFILIHTSLEAQTLLLLKVKCVIPVLLVAENRFAKYSDYF